MSIIVSKFDFDRNFWEFNTQLKAAEPFKTFYNEDKSKKKEKSSMIMWAIALCYDFDSQYFGVEETQRQEMIGTDLVGDKDLFTTDQIKTLSEMYQTVTDTAARRQMRVWHKKLDEKSTFMKSLPYDIKNWKIIDEMLKTNKELYDSYAKIEKMIMNESTDTVEGGSEESMMEKNQFKNAK